MNLFIGIVTNPSGVIVHEHLAEASCDSFHVEIWGENEPIIKGEFRKWHHLEKEVSKFPGFVATGKTYSIPVKELIGFLE